MILFAKLKLMQTCKRRDNNFFLIVCEIFRVRNSIKNALKREQENIYQTFVAVFSDQFDAKCKKNIQPYLYKQICSYIK